MSISSLPSLHNIVHTEGIYYTIFIFRVFFSSSEEREFWYKVRFEAVDPAVIEVPILTCEIGR